MVRLNIGDYRHRILEEDTIRVVARNGVGVNISVEGLQHVSQDAGIKFTVISTVREKVTAIPIE